MTDSSPQVPPEDDHNNAVVGSEADVPNMSLEDITEGSQRGIPQVKFLDDIEAFANSFSPPAQPELLIGGFSQLHAKYKSTEASLQNKQQHLKQKVPELEKSMTLVQTLLQKQQQNAAGKVRYNLTDCVYATAQIDYGTAKVGLFLGANVMLEYEYAEALEFLTSNLQRAQTELENVETDLSYVRDQIVTCEVLTSRIFNWDVRQRRQHQSNATSASTTYPQS